MKPKIFCWVNSGVGTEFQIVMAMAEDGAVLASHCSSSETWAKHDIGLNSDWKNASYQLHYPDGYELVWIAPGEKSEGLDAAYAKHIESAPSAPPRTSDSETGGQT